MAEKARTLYKICLKLKINFTHADLSNNVKTRKLCANKSPLVLTVQVNKLWHWAFFYIDTFCCEALFITILAALT